MYPNKSLRLRDKRSFETVCLRYSLADRHMRSSYARLGEVPMSQSRFVEEATPERRDLRSSSSAATQDILTRLAEWIDNRKIPFLVTSIGMIVMLLWAGAYKMTAPGAEGIIPLVSHSPLISWHFKLFGPYIGSDLIGLTEITAAVLIIAGYLKPKAGIAGGLIATLMFFITSSMVVTTPGSTALVHGIRYMSFIGLFLFKDVISLGVSLYLISYFGKRAIDLENRR